MTISCKNIRFYYNTGIAIFLLMLLFFSHKGHGQEWELKKDKKGIKIYVRQSESSKLKEYKAVMLIKTSMDKALKILTDGNNLWKWNHRTVESKIIKTISENEFIFWMKNNLPWPLKNRDHVSRIKVIHEERGSITMHINPETTHPVPQVKNTIRIKNFRGYWLLIPQGEYLEITHQLYGDPAGSIPAWVMNSVITSGPYNSFLNLKELLEN